MRPFNAVRMSPRDTVRLSRWFLHWGRDVHGGCIPPMAHRTADLGAAFPSCPTDFARLVQLLTLPVGRQIVGRSQHGAVRGEI